MRWLVSGITCLLILVACGSPDPQGTAPGDAPSKSGDDPSTERPSSEILYTCGYGAFPPKALEGPGDLARSDTPLGEALRRLLATPDGAMGDQGWRIVVDDGNKVVVAAPTGREKHPYVSAYFERSGESWEPRSWGDCLPMAVVGDRSTATWKLESEPQPHDTEVVLLVEERACSSGRKLTEDNTVADITYTEDEIQIVMSGDPLRGAYTCIGNIPSPVTVELEEPIGDRKLVDAGSYPPQRRD